MKSFSGKCKGKDLVKEFDKAWAKLEHKSLIDKIKSFLKRG